MKISRKEEESPYTSPSGVDSLEDGEIRESPDLSSEYQESFDIKTESSVCFDELQETKTVRFRKDLSPPKTDWAIDQAESELFEIPFNEQGSSVGKSDPPLAVFGRPLPRTRPDQFVSISKKLNQPLSAGKKGSSLILSPVDSLYFQLSSAENSEVYSQDKLLIYFYIPDIISTVLSLRWLDYLVLSRRGRL